MYLSRVNEALIWKMSVYFLMWRDDLEMRRKMVYSVYLADLVVDLVVDLIMAGRFRLVLHPCWRTPWKPRCDWSSRAQSDQSQRRFHTPTQL